MRRCGGGGETSFSDWLRDDAEAISVRCEAEELATASTGESDGETASSVTLPASTWTICEASGRSSAC